MNLTDSHHKKKGRSAPTEEQEDEERMIMEFNIILDSQ